MNRTTITIRGLTPLLMHNGQLADPLNDAAKALARLSKKRNKTDDDHLALRKCEWYGGLYVNADGVPCLPGELIEACFADGAKQYKLGKVVKGGLIIDGNFALDYDGPKNVDRLWDHGGYIKTAGVKVQQSRLIRTRPMFPAWSCSFDVDWDPTLVKDEEQLMEIAAAAGMRGIGDWRPKFGRFVVSGYGEGRRG